MRGNSINQRLDKGRGIFSGHRFYSTIGASSHICPSCFAILVPAPRLAASGQHLCQIPTLDTATEGLAFWVIDICI
jgi:hypothetical protein